jgi:hypothetical protein
MAAISVETRRVPRVPARCPAEIAFGAGRWVGLTQDLGPGGCRIVARIALHPGEPLSLKLRYGGVDFALDVVGTVAWTARRPPWHTGVAFARGQESKARRFVRAVLDADPELTPGKAVGGFRTGAAPGQPGSVPQHLPQTLLPPVAARLRALIVAARSQRAAGNMDEALRSLHAALKLAPGHPEVVSELKALGVE